MFAEGEITDATEDEGHFEPVAAPPKVAGYVHVEPSTPSALHPGQAGMSRDT